MRKLRFLIIPLLFAFYGKMQAQDDVDPLAAYMASDDFKWFGNQSRFGQDVKPDEARSYFSYEDYQGKRVPFIVVSLKGLLANGKEGEVGQIEAIKVRDDYQQLPRNARYLQIYKDLREYDLATKTGRLRVYDLNYDEYLAVDAQIRNENIESVNTYPMPAEVAERYGFNRQENMGSKTHPCDGNGNGNVSFGECMSCMITACWANPNCKRMCKLIGLPRCGAAFVISCTYLAIAY